MVGRRSLPSRGLVSFAISCSHQHKRHPAPADASRISNGSSSMPTFTGTGHVPTPSAQDTAVLPRPAVSPAPRGHRLILTALPPLPHYPHFLLQISPSQPLYFFDRSRARGFAHSTVLRRAPDLPMPASCSTRSSSSYYRYRLSSCAQNKKEHLRLVCTVDAVGPALSYPTASGTGRSSVVTCTAWPRAAVGCPCCPALVSCARAVTRAGAIAVRPLCRVWAVVLP